MNTWLGNRKRILVLNREDMISAADRDAWATYYARQGTKVVFSNGQHGMVTSIFRSLFLNMYVYIYIGNFTVSHSGNHET